MELNWDHLSKSSSSSKVLVVILHGYTCGRWDVKSVENAARESYADADIYRPTLPLSLFSIRHPDEIVAALLSHIDEIWEAGKGTYQKVILVGHSMGALLARKLYVCACGETRKAPFAAQFDTHFDAPLSKDEKKKTVKIARPWAECVDRLVLLAGMNRGWQISHHLSLFGAGQWLLGLIVCRLCMMFGKTPLIMHIKRGAVFLTELRVLWIHMQERASPSPECKKGEPKKEPSLPEGTPSLGGALTVQLLGSIDDLVSPEDNIDLIAGRKFIYLDMPYSGHMSAVELGTCASRSEKVAEAEDRPLTPRELRRNVFQAALTEDREVLDKDWAVVPSDDMQPAKADSCVTDVIFVIHGIRDRGYWTHKVARRVLKTAEEINEKTLGEKKIVKLATETSSYGYFAMLSFMLPWRRRVKVEWLMDQYAEALALYPKAEFSFIGHSNGTYLLAKALLEYPLCKFKHVIFAGSVVPTNFDWSKIAQRKQVDRVMNFTASSDWVVALFPKIFQSLPIQDLGSAGHDGFRSLPDQPGFLTQKRYAGQHGAALVEENWDAIADFILTGDSDRYPEALTPAKPNPVWMVLGELSVAIVAGILFLLYFIAMAIWGLENHEWLKTVYLMIFGFIVFKIATKV